MKDLQEERSTREPSWFRPSCAAFFCISLMVFWITLNPLKDLSQSSMLDPTESSDLTNQILYITIFILSMVILIECGWRSISPLLHPAYFAVIGWFSISSIFSLNPTLSLRRLGLTAIIMAIVGVLVILPRSRREFENLLAAAALTVVALCFFVVAFLPNLAVHQPNAALETNLAGDWRGIYEHKSITGSMMVVFVFIGCFLIERRRTVLGLCLCGLSTYFLLFTGAKQPQALLPFVLIWSWFAARVRSTRLLLALCLVPLLVYLLFTIGSVIFPEIATIDQAIMADPTFTNRTGIWRYAIDRLLERPLLGHGFHSFWNTQSVRFSDVDGPDAWAATASHSHNSYLDLALTTGIPGLLVGSWSLILQPILDYAAARKKSDDEAFVKLFFRVWLFATLLSSMETFFYQRDEPFWISFLIAIFGLRYLASYRPILRASNQRATEVPLSKPLTACSFDSARYEQSPHGSPGRARRQPRRRGAPE